MARKYKTRKPKHNYKVVYGEYEVNFSTQQDAKIFIKRSVSVKNRTIAELWREDQLIMKYQAGEWYLNSQLTNKE